MKYRGGGGGGYSEIFHIHRLSRFLGGQNYEFPYFGGFSENLDIFRVWVFFFSDIFLGSLQNLTIFMGVLL